MPSSFTLVLKRLHPNLLNIVTLLTLKVILGDQPTRLAKNIDYLQLKIVNINPHRDKNLVVPTVCGLLKQILSQLIHQCFGHVSINRIKRMTGKGLMEGLLENIPELGELCPICLLTKATKTPKGTTTDV